MTEPQWVVHDPDSGNERTVGSRAEAEETAAEMNDLGMDVDIIPPGSTDDHDAGPGMEASCQECGEPVDVREAKSGPRGMPIHPECYDGAEVVEAEAVPDEEFEGSTDMADLPERSVGDDPLKWMPSEFIDTIDSSVAINRKGFEVLAWYYDIDVFADLEVAPEETDHEYCRVKARAVSKESGREVEAYGSAHIDRGDDAHLLLEMADTRARKRALSIATGVGMVAVEELKNEVD
jgi:hypothetical protein